MKLLLSLVGILLVLAGCATHYHQMDGGIVTLYLDVPAGRQVSLACSRDGFVPHPTRREHRRWAVSLPAAGPFRYFYLVDGAVYVPPVGCGKRTTSAPRTVFSTRGCNLFLPVPFYMKKQQYGAQTDPNHADGHCRLPCFGSADGGRQGNPALHRAATGRTGWLTPWNTAIVFTATTGSGSWPSCCT